MEVLDWTRINEVDWDRKVDDEQLALSTSMMESKLNMDRYDHGCDVMDAKGGMIVIGGGRSIYQSVYGWRNERSRDPALNSIEMYDHHTDKWMLHPIKTQQKYESPRLWCSGHLIFMVQNRTCGVGHFGRIEFMDIRENAKKWDFIDDKVVEKLYDLYTTKPKFQYLNRGFLI